MNLTPKIIKILLDEKKTVFNNHPDMYRFVLNTFAKRLEKDSEIEIIVRRPNGEVDRSEMKLLEEDEKFFQGISMMLQK